MSTCKTIFLYTGGMAIEAVAERIASAIGGRITRDRGNISVTRDMRTTSDGWVGGKVEANLFLRESQEETDPSVLDLYDISCYVRCSQQPEEHQRAEARLVYDGIIRNLGWPALLTHDTDLLISAWAPGFGRTDFPDDTPSYAAISHSGEVTPTLPRSPLIKDARERAMR